MNRMSLIALVSLFWLACSGSLLSSCKQKKQPAPQARKNDTRNAPVRNVDARKTPDSGPTTGGKKLSCRQRLDLSRQLVKTAYLKVKKCSTDKDCTLIRLRTGCTGACPRPVAASGVASVKAAIASANKTWCATYRADGCPYKMVKCGVPTPVCKAGVCVRK